MSTPKEKVFDDRQSSYAARIAAVKNYARKKRKKGSEKGTQLLR